MKITNWLLAFGFVVFGLSSAYSGESSDGGGHQFISNSTAARTTPSPSMGIKGHRSVIGTVSKVTENMLTLETAEGTTRNITVKSAKIDGVTKLQPGDRVLLELDEENQIVGVNDLGETHQLIRGEVASIDRDKKTVTLKIKNGTSQSYGMKEAMAGKMNNIAKGSMVTLMVDQRNNLAMDVHID